MKKLILITICLLLGACSTAETFVTQLYKPRPYGLAETPEGSPLFQQGWEDGCETGLQAYGNDRYKAAYEFKQDPKLINNNEYYRAWKDAYVYCRWYAVSWIK